MGKQSEELVLQVTATQELLERQLRAMGQNVDTFEQAAENRIEQLEKRFSGINLRGAVDAVRDADKAFRASFDGINRQAAELADNLGKTGRIDLTPMIEQSRTRAGAAELEATVLRRLAQAEEARQATLAQVTLQEQAALSATRAATVAAEQRAVAATTEAQRLQALQAQLGQVTTAQVRAVGASEAHRYAMVNVGNQFGDFFVQISGGTSAIRAFSQQAPQLLGALQMMSMGASEGTSKFAAFARFLSGGWGIALTAAIPLIGIFAQSLTGMGNEAKAAVPKMDALTEAVNRLNAARGRATAGAIGDAKLQIAISKGELSLLDQQIAAAEKKEKPYREAVRYGGSPTAALKAPDIIKVGDIVVDGEVIKEATLREAREKRLDLNKRLLRSENDLAGAVSAKRFADDWKEAEEARQKARRAAESAAKRDAREEESEREKAAKKAAKDLETFYGRAQDTYSDLVNGRVVPLKPSGILAQDDKGATDKFADQMMDAYDRMKMAQKELADTAKGTHQAWVTSAQGVLGAVQQMKGALSGDFLDILSAALGLFTQLGTSGLLGKSVQTNMLYPSIGALGKRAAGGPVTGGTPYLVGEKGPELFVPGASGSIVANDNLRTPRLSSSDYAGAGVRDVRVHVVADANDYFDLRVRSISGAVAGPVGVAAAQGGAGIAATRIARRSRNSIPRSF
jgi:hypothetical protein